MPGPLDEARRLLHHHFGHADFRPAQLPVLQSVLAGSDTLAVLPTGDDAGSLLFTSNFDGPWENYIEDFAAKSAPTFDAIYCHCEGWPPNGARDVDAFEAYVRKYEVPVEVYYRAYPMATVRQVRSALRLKAATTAMLDMLNE